ncbi:MAG: hypothetical protein AAGU11_22005, partial [Syntrophobacteraceae bacterium]
MPNSLYAMFYRAKIGNYHAKKERPRPAISLQLRLQIAAPRYIYLPASPESGMIIEPLPNSASPTPARAREFGEQLL